jgi:hypothetical protein
MKASRAIDYTIRNYFIPGEYLVKYCGDIDMLLSCGCGILGAG